MWRTAGCRRSPAGVGAHDGVRDRGGRVRAPPRVSPSTAERWGHRWSLLEITSAPVSSGCRPDRKWRSSGKCSAWSGSVASRICDEHRIFRKVYRHDIQQRSECRCESWVLVALFWRYGAKRCDEGRWGRAGISTPLRRACLLDTVRVQPTSSSARRGPAQALAEVKHVRSRSGLQSTEARTPSRPRGRLRSRWRPGSTARRQSCGWGWTSARPPSSSFSFPSTRLRPLPALGLTRRRCRLCPRCLLSTGATTRMCAVS